MRLDPRTIGLLGFIALVFAAVAFFNNQREASLSATGTPAFPTAVTTGPIFGAIDQLRVVRYEIRSNTDATFVVMSRDTANVWTVQDGTNKADRLTDQVLATGSMGVLVSLAASDRFPATDLAPFGLTAPAFTFSFTLDDGTMRTLSVGNTAPGGLAYYGQVDGQGDVVVIPQDFTFRLSRLIAEPPYVAAPTATPIPTFTPDPSIALFPSTLTTDQLRTLNIIDNVANQVVTVEQPSMFSWSVLQASAGNISLPPDQLRIQQAAQEFIGMRYLRSFSAQDVPAYNPADYGLTTPAYTLTGTTNSGSVFSMVVGAPNGAAGPYYVLVTQVVIPPTPQAPLQPAFGDGGTTTPTPPPTATLQPTLTPTAVAETVIYVVSTERLAFLLALPTNPPLVQPAAPIMELTAEATGEATAEALPITDPMMAVPTLAP
jgi:hypothetical protein